METRLQIVAVAAALLLLAVILELVRRKRLLERYALVWLGSAAVLLMLAIWRGLLKTIADGLGIFYPPNALFLIAFGFVLLLLLHFSLAVSRLSDQSKILAQRLALLEERVDQAEAVSEKPGTEPDPFPAEAQSGTGTERPTAPTGARTGP